MTLGFILGPWFLNIPTGQSTIPGVYFWRVPFTHPIGSHGLEMVQKGCSASGKWRSCLR